MSFVKRYKIQLGIVTIALVALGVYFFSQPTPQQPNTSPRVQTVSNRPVQEPSDGYVGSQACRECHVDEYSSWYESYHRTMTQVVSAETVIGDFNDVTIHDRGKEFFLKRRGNEFVAEFDEPILSASAGEPIRVERPMVMSTGSHHMQMYWYPISPESRVVGLLPLVYLRDDQQWVPRDFVFLRPHQDNARIEIGRWNIDCIQCHATHGKTGIDIESSADETYYNPLEAKTSVVEFGISCEECHGPGERHVKEFTKSAAQTATKSDRYIVHPGRVDAERSVEICGQCHGNFNYIDAQERQRVYKHGETFRPGEKLAESRIILKDEADYDSDTMKELGSGNHFLQKCWNDGMVRVSGREFNAVVQSPCFESGKLTCLTCHQMHHSSDDERPTNEWNNDQLRPGMRTNAACTQCHESYRDEQTLVEHSHHAADSAGSNCYNCHASYTTYGLLKAIRSHEIDSPNVAASLKTGRPNACNQCHLDQTRSWTAQHLNDWYEIEPPELSDEDREIAASILWLLRGDAGQRALAAWSYGWKDAQRASGTEWMPPYLAQLLEDPYHAVRYIANRSLKKLPNFADFDDFQFLGSPDSWKKAHTAAMQRWAETTKFDREDLSPVLIDPEGNLDRGKFQALFGERDDRTINLLE